MLFHVGGQDLFDKTLSFKREGEKDGALRVIVDLVDGETFCPIEMGWISGGRGACGLEFRFRNEFQEDEYWLHVVWQADQQRGLARGLLQLRAYGPELHSRGGPKAWPTTRLE